MLTEEPTVANRRGKPILPLRCATDFVFYDVNSENVMTSPWSFIERDEQDKTALRCAARVRPTSARSEDAALDEEVDEGGEDGGEWVLLDDITCVSYNYAEFSS
jgi:hypothetical protein